MVTRLQCFRSNGSSGLPALIAMTVGLVAGVAPAAASGSAWPPPEAAEFAARALERHPALQAARLEVDAVHAWARHHGSWEAPSASVNFFNAPVSAFPDPLRRQDEIDWSLTQEIPFPGKLGRMAAPEHARAGAADSRVDAAALALRRRVLAAWADAYAADWSLRLARENRGDVSAAAGDARAGYAGGRASLASLRAERELAELDAEILERTAARAAALERLAEAAGGDTVVTAVDSTGLLPRGAADRLEVLLAASSGVEARPDLEALRREREAAGLEVSAARAERLPDLMVGAMYKDMRNPGREDAWSLMLGMKLSFLPFPPWSSAPRYAERRARILRARADRMLGAATADAVAETAAARARLDAALGRVRIARDEVTPLADRVLEAARAEYAAGRAGFADVTEAARAARRAREMRRLAEADVLRAWAEWEQATGGGGET